MRALRTLQLLCCTALLPLAAAQVVTLFAGSSSSASGSANGVGTSARFFTPTGLVALPSGALIVSDFENGRLREVSTATATVRTFLGPLANSRPTGLALDPAATTLYMADSLNHNVLRITGILATPTPGILAGSATQTQGLVNGVGTNAKFRAPQGLATDAAGLLYVADFENSVIRSVTPAGLVAVFAGSGAAGFNDGPAADASFWKPSAIAIDGASNKYVTDTWNYLVRLINPAGLVSTLAGSPARGFRDGVGAAAAFFNPRHATLSPIGLLVSDFSNNALRCINLTTLEVTTLAGNGSAGAANGVGRAATLRAPIGSVVVGGDLFLATAAPTPCGAWRGWCRCRRRPQRRQPR
jgi:DNA-binding beta-propeller fold protein YncE